MIHAKAERKETRQKKSSYSQAVADGTLILFHTTTQTYNRLKLWKETL